MPVRNASNARRRERRERDASRDSTDFNLETSESDRPSGGLLPGGPASGTFPSRTTSVVPGVRNRGRCDRAIESIDGSTTEMNPYERNPTVEKRCPRIAVGSAWSQFSRTVA